VLIGIGSDRAGQGRCRAGSVGSKLALARGRASAWVTAALLGHRVAARPPGRP